MKKFKKISILIPIFNEENYIRKTINAVLKANTLGLKKEIIINDVSTDNTKKILENIKRKHKNLIIIHNQKNQGKGYSLKKGFLKSTGDIVLAQDADLEYSPSDYPKLINPFLKNDADVVYGSRFISSEPHRVLYFWHYLVNIFLTTLSNMLTNLNLTDMETGFKIFKVDLIRKIAPHLQSKRFGFEPEITARIAKIKDIKIYENI